MRGKLGLVLMGGTMLSKSLIQFSVDGRGCVPSLLFDLRPDYGGGHEDNGHFPQKVPCINCHTQCLQPCSRPLPTTPPLGLFHTHRQVWVSLLWGHCSFLLGLLSPWCTQGSVCALQESVSPVLCKFWQLCGGVNGDLLQEGLCHTQGLLHPEPWPCSIHC